MPFKKEEWSIMARSIKRGTIRSQKYSDNYRYVIRTIVGIKQTAIYGEGE
jgi:hypothetical protein